MKPGGDLGRVRASKESQAFKHVSGWILELGLAIEVAIEAAISKTQLTMRQEGSDGAYTP